MRNTVSDSCVSMLVFSISKRAIKVKGGRKQVSPINIKEQKSQLLQPQITVTDTSLSSSICSHGQSGNSKKWIRLYQPGKFQLHRNRKIKLEYNKKSRN